MMISHFVTNNIICLTPDIKIANEKLHKKIMDQFSQLLQIICVFAPEIYGVWCIVVLIVFGICTKKY